MTAKVCGLTRVADVQQARAAGAGLLGFVHHPASPRHCVDIPATANGVGEQGVLVMVSDDADLIVSRARAAALRWVQPYVHADFRNEVIARLRASGVRVLLPWPDAPGNLVLDVDLYLWETSPAQTGMHGGSGQVHALQHPPPGEFLLAGGLDASNVAARFSALRLDVRARCRGMDAASRLESSPGMKSHAAVTEFLRSVHAIAH